MECLLSECQDRSGFFFNQWAGSDSEDTLIYFLIPLYNMNKWYSVALWHWSRDKTLIILMVMKGKAVG
jgi:predicted cupin superfamily sugar epimerase